MSQMQWLTPGGLPGDAGRVEAQGAGHGLVPVVAVAEPDHLGAGEAGHQGGAVEDGVPALDQPGLGADGLHVPGHLQHEAEVVEAPMEAAP